MYRSESFAHDIDRLFIKSVTAFKEYLAMSVDLPYEVAFGKCHLPNYKVIEDVSKNYSSNIKDGYDTYDLSLKDIFKVSSVEIDDNNNVVVVYDYGNIRSVVVFTDFNLRNKMAFIEGVCIFLDMADDILHPDKDCKSYY